MHVLFCELNVILMSYKVEVNVWTMMPIQTIVVSSKLDKLKGDFATLGAPLGILRNVE